jgi:PAS domain S-box-containing protein
MISSVGILLVFLWLLGLVVLALHRLSPRFGLTPFFIFTGGLCAALNVASLGFFRLTLAGQTLHLAYGSFLLFPILMLALLVVYVINGTLQARAVLVGILLLTSVIGLLNILPFQSLPLPNLAGSDYSPGGLTARELLASAIALAADAVLLFTVYQWVCNLRRKSPSQLAGFLALLCAALGDAILYPAFAAPWAGEIRLRMLAHVAGKTFSILALWPLFAFYLSKVAPVFPDTAATAPRPAFDLFTTRKQLEARAHYHYQLFRTLAQVNKMIAGADNSQALLDKVCQVLVNQLDYPLVWIGLLGGENLVPLPAAKAGPQAAYLKALAAQGDQSEWFEGPVGSALQAGQGAARLDIARSAGEATWKKLALQYGLRSCAAFPMRQAEHRLGVLVVYGKRPFAFNLVEMDLLQELADSLANALINLGTRRQQMVLYSAAETMQDGLIIADMHGAILYANPAVSRLFLRYTESLAGKNIKHVLPDPREREFIEQQYAQLVKDGRIAFEFEHHARSGRLTYFSVNAALVHGLPGLVNYAVVNLRDTTRRRQYERLLLALHQYTNDIVQAHRIEDLLEKIFQASEEILQADASEIYLLAEDGRTVMETYCHNLPEACSSRVSRDFHSLPGDLALKACLPVAVSDVSADPEFGGRLQFLAKYELRALLVLPVLLQSRPIGAFTLYYRQPRVFQEDEIQLGVTLVQTLAIAIQNARLYQAEHRQRQLAEALAQAAIALKDSLDMEKVLEEILNQVMAVIPCRSVSLMLVEGDSARLVRSVDRFQLPGAGASGLGSWLPLTTASLQSMLESRQPLLIADTQVDPVWAHRDTSSWVRSYAGAPLIADEQVIGFLNLNSETPNFFTVETARHLQAFGSYAAAAIQNARMYRQLEFYAAELEQRVGERTTELRAAKEQMERILVSVPDAIFVLDENRRLIQANPAGENLLVLASTNGQDVFSGELFAHLTSGSAPHEKAVVEVGGRAYQALASALPVQGSGVWSVIVFRDVTRFRELDQIKSKFVSDVSHELRTPLTNLSLYNDLLASARTPEARAKYLATLRRETERLTDLIEGLLTISRLEAGRIEVNLQAVDLNRLVSNLTVDRSQLAASRELALCCGPQAALPLVMTDPHLLTQVLSNLLTNAFNYTPPGGSIRVCASCYPGSHLPAGSGGNGRPSPSLPDGCSGWAAIEVRDSGVGIQPEELPQLFTRFFRGAASRETNAPGTGLGLAISKEIMERLGGCITVESAPGQGSAFTLWLRTGDML